jgi:hypothetical protein
MVVVRNADVVALGSALVVAGVVVVRNASLVAVGSAGVVVGVVVVRNADVVSVGSAGVVVGAAAAASSCAMISSMTRQSMGLTILDTSCLPFEVVVLGAVTSIAGIVFLFQQALIAVTAPMATIMARTASIVVWSSVLVTRARIAGGFAGTDALALVVTCVSAVFVVAIVVTFAGAVVVVAAAVNGMVVVTCCFVAVVG